MLTISHLFDKILKNAKFVHLVDLSNLEGHVHSPLAGLYTGKDIKSIDGFYIIRINCQCS